MPPTPRQSLSDAYTANMNCPICGQLTLKVFHTDRLPDYVACGNCESAFIVEDGGDRVLFGKISDSYPRTQQFALRQWAWIEAIERWASEERPPEPGPSPPSMEHRLRSAAVPIPTEPETPLPPQIPVPLSPVEARAPEPEPELAAPEQPEPALEEQADPETYEGLVEMPPDAISPAIPEPPMSYSLNELLEVGDLEGYDELEETPADLIEPQADRSVMPDELEEEELDLEPEAPPWDAAIYPPMPDTDPLVREAEISPPPPMPSEDEPEEIVYEPPASDPPPGSRFRVAIKGDKVQFPKDACAHCMRVPVRGRLAVIGDLPEGQRIGQRKATSFNLPLCKDCRNRAQQLSPEARNDRLQAYLISTLTALVLLVAALAWGVDLQEQPQSGVLILAILAILGFSIPAFILLGRARNFPIPPDARYIRSTLIVPADAQGLETAFEFRNQEYAEKFHAANEPVTLSFVTAVKDRLLPDS